MKKRIFIILSIILIISVVVVIYLINKGKNNDLLEISKTIEINSEVNLSDLIEVDLVEDKLIDTDTLGNTELEFKYRKDKKELEGILKLKIVDTTKPVIEYQKELTTTVGTKIDLLKDVVVSDNSKEEITASVNGEYDFNHAGTYNLEYIATDSSENICIEKFILKVQNKKVTKYDYTKLPEPSGEKIEVGKTSKGYTIYKIDGSIYIDGILIVNKTYPLKDGFVPSDTYKSAVGVTKECNTCINNTAYAAFKEMQADALSIGLNIRLTSGYRPLNIQKIIYNNYVRRDGKVKADTYSARPNHSEHQTGLTFDLNSITDAFATTKEGIWTNENCYKYGFIIRYPKGKEDITGFKYESWHLRFVGTDLSYKLYNDGDWITLEEYFGITSAYQN